MIRAHVHRGMVVFSEREYRGESLKALHRSLDTRIRWHRKWYGESLSEAKRSAQVSVNHEHMTSMRAAKECVSEMAEAMRRDHPELVRYLVADWRLGVQRWHRRERGNVVLLSFWLDTPTRERSRVTDRMLKANLTPEQWKATLQARRKKRGAVT